MDRISGASTIDIGGGRRGFRDEDLPTGVEGTVVTAAHLNAIQEEIMHIIEDAGMDADPAVWTQLLTAISRHTQTGKWSYATAGGSANALTVTLTPAPESLVPGMSFRAKALAANTISAVTMAVNGLEAKPIKHPDATSLLPGAIGAGVVHEFCDCGTFIALMSAKAAAPMPEYSYNDNGWYKFPGRMIMQWGTTPLPPVGNFNAETVGGVTWYTHYAQIPFPIMYPNLQMATTVTLAGPNIFNQQQLFRSFAFSNRGSPDSSGAQVSKDAFDVGIATRTLGFVPTVHWISIGY